MTYCSDQQQFSICSDQLTYMAGGNWLPSVAQWMGQITNNATFTVAVLITQPTALW